MKMIKHLLQPQLKSYQLLSLIFSKFSILNSFVELLEELKVSLVASSSVFKFTSAAGILKYNTPVTAMRTTVATDDHTIPLRLEVFLSKLADTASQANAGTFGEKLLNLSASCWSIFRFLFSRILCFIWWAFLKLVLLTFSVICSIYFWNLFP